MLHFDDYILGKQLGSGHYAVVKEAKDKKRDKLLPLRFSILINQVW